MSGEVERQADVEDVLSLMRLQLRARDVDAADWLAADRASVAAAARREALEEALAGIKTHNGVPLTAANLRWAATHESMCRSWTFDVLMGLAAAREASHGEEAGRG